jgi:hypothetical protein
VRDFFRRCERILTADKDIGSAVEEQGRNRELTVLMACGSMARYVLPWPYLQMPDTPPIFIDFWF